MGSVGFKGSSCPETQLGCTFCRQGKKSLLGTARASDRDSPGRLQREAIDLALVVNGPCLPQLWKAALRRGRKVACQELRNLRRKIFWRSPWTIFFIFFIFFFIFFFYFYFFFFSPATSAPFSSDLPSDTPLMLQTSQPVALSASSSAPGVGNL
ncbi:hypothetical protein VTK26DRAFT_7711 [Humicola hyalothermophila]